MNESATRFRARTSRILLVAGAACGLATLILLGVTAWRLVTRQLRPQAETGHWTTLWLDLLCYPLAAAVVTGLLLHLAWKLRR